MKLFLSTLILLFSFQSLIKADISEFEIEGISIGDSLFKFYSSDEIKQFKKSFYPGSKKYYRLINYDENKKLIEYDDIMFAIKENDIDYKVVSVIGIFNYENNINECYPKKKIIDNDLEKSLKTVNNSYVFDYPNDRGKSNVTDYKFSNGYIRTWCTDYSLKAEKNNFSDHFGISITPDFYLKWIDNEAY